MPHKNKLYALLSSILFIFLTCIYSVAQELPGSNDSDDQIFTDSIPLSENLLDSNEVYKKQFDSLSKDGDWIKVKKSDFVRDLSKGTGEEFPDFNYDDEQYINFWRPYGTGLNWNPYTNGRWEFSYYGWVWLSDYSWGWGPYHYGRWYYSNYYGWIWMPGYIWAANWVMWRQHNLYVGWYPTCPQIYWRDQRHKWHRNRVYSCKPANWVFVGKPDFTKKIDEKVIANKDEYARILKNSEKTVTAVYSDNETKKFRYSGPDVKIISRETGEKITPKSIDIKISNAGNSKNELSKTSDKKNYVNPEIKKAPGTNDQKTGSVNKGDTKVRSKKDRDYKNYKAPDNEGSKNDPPVRREGDQKNTDQKNYNEPKKENNDVNKNEGSRENNEIDMNKSRK